MGSATGHSGKHPLSRRLLQAQDESWPGSHSLDSRRAAVGELWPASERAVDESGGCGDRSTGWCCSCPATVALPVVGGGGCVVVGAADVGAVAA